MIRTCPKCGDYYADASLAFCLADGTPLVNVDQFSESWSEGTRVIEEKENALRKQKRKLKQRRVVITAMTMLIATMVVCVVAVNGLIYLKPEQEETALAAPQTPATSPDRLIDSITPGTPDEPSPTPELRPTVTPKPNPRVPTPTPKPSPSPPPPPQKCSVADKGREQKTIIDKYGDQWRRMIEGDRREIIAQHIPAGLVNGLVPAGVAKVEAILGEIKYEVGFTKECAATVTARYVWQVKINFNGRIRAAPDEKQKKFACVKVGETWRCG